MSSKVKKTCPNCANVVSGPQIQMIKFCPYCGHEYGMVPTSTPRRAREDTKFDLTTFLKTCPLNDKERLDEVRKNLNQKMEKNHAS